MVCPCPSIPLRLLDVFHAMINLFEVFPSSNRASMLKHAIWMLSTGERCEFNFGERPFNYPMPGFQPLVDPPSHVEAAHYLLGCLRRIANAKQITSGAWVRHPHLFCLQISHSKTSRPGLEGCCICRLDDYIISFEDYAAFATR